MLKYIGKRIFIFLPTLFVITLLGFVIAINAPGDPVERMVVASQGGDVGSQSISQIEQKNLWRKKLGLDLPVFYFSLSQFSHPDTLYKIYNKGENESLNTLIETHGNWNEISLYYNHVLAFHRTALIFKYDSTLLRLKDQNLLNENINSIRSEALALLSSYDDRSVSFKLARIKGILKSHSCYNSLQKQFILLFDSYRHVVANESSWKNYIPKIIFYGHKNQYHRWLFGDGEFSKGLINFDLKPDFGISYQTKQPISEVISSKIGWSLFFSLLSVILAYAISIPIGVKAAVNRGGRFDRVSTVVLFMLYSLPSFFVAVLLLMTFANPDMINLFPASGVKPPAGYPDGASFFEKVRMSFPYIIIPLLCYTYTSFAFLSRMMKSAMIEVMHQDYIRTAHAKGLEEKTVVWKHAFRNSLLPIITVFANIFPAAVGGSVILETIFTIPGMGFESFLAIQTQNYPMIIAVLTITGTMTLIGYLISDILYAVVDPRIRY